MMQLPVKHRLLLTGTPIQVGGNDDNNNFCRVKTLRLLTKVSEQSGRAMGAV
jgi:hypothetical protein